MIYNLYIVSKFLKILQSSLAKINKTESEEIKYMAVNSIHAGHRKDMRDKVLEHGIEILREHEILEIMLYYAIPMKDTNPLAHELLNQFGSISAVFDAPYDILCKSGLTENAAFMVKYIPEILSIYMSDKYDNNNKIVDMDNLPQKFINRFLGKNKEMLYLLLMDSKYKEIYFNVISKGNNTNTDINTTKICELAVKYSARYAIIAHNHPSGSSLPSKADILATINLNQALRSLNVKLLDHFVVADLDCVSLHDANVLFNSREEYEESGIYKMSIFD